MAAKTLLELRNATRALVGDSVRYDPADGITVLQGPTTWTDQEVNDALNYAQNDYCSRKQQTTVVATLQSGSSAPISSFGEETVVHAEFGGVGMDKSNLNFEDRLNPSWRVGSSGSPKRWLTHEGIFYLSPNANGLTATVLYLEVPAPMSGNSAVPDSRITEAHHTALTYMAASHLLIQGRDQASSQKAGTLTAVYLNLIGLLAAAGA